MYSILLSTHNIVRWLALAVGVYAVVRVWRGWVTRAVWSEGDAKLLKVFPGVASLQFVIGLLLYIMSPLVRQGFADFGFAMRDPSLRKFVVEHPILMIAFVGLAHVGAKRAGRAPSDSGKFQTATIFWGIAMLLLLAGIPWNRPFLPF